MGSPSIRPSAVTHGRGWRAWPTSPSLVSDRSARRTDVVAQRTSAWTHPTSCVCTPLRAAGRATWPITPAALRSRYSFLDLDGVINFFALDSPLYALLFTIILNYTIYTAISAPVLDRIALAIILSCCRCNGHLGLYISILMARFVVLSWQETACTSVPPTHRTYLVY